MQRNEHEHIMQALSGSPEKVDIRVEKTWIEREPRRVTVKGEKGEPATTEETDEFDEVEYYSGVIQRGDIPCGIQGRIKDLLSIRKDADPDDYAANVSKTKALVILSQIDAMKNGTQSALPHGHIDVQNWPAVASQPVVLAILKHHGVRSVQQMAQMMEAQLARMPPGIQAQRLRDLAQSYLAQQQSVIADGNRGEVDALKAEVSDLKAMLEKLIGAGLAKLDDKAKPAVKLEKAA
jgi:hypothetical protein